MNKTLTQDSLKGSAQPYKALSRLCLLSFLHKNSLYANYVILLTEYSAQSCRIWTILTWLVKNYVLSRQGHR